VGNSPDVTICIKTLVRPLLLKRLLDSLMYTTEPGARIIVADDSPDHLQSDGLCAEYPGVRFLPLEDDVGLSAGRNAMIDAIDTSYFVMLDDDFVSVDAHAISMLVDSVRCGLFDIAGGHVTHHGQHAHYEGFIEVRDRTLHLTSLKHPVSGPTRCDITYNFLAGDAQKARHVRWDDRLKLCEHQAFFLRAKAAGLNVGYVPDAWIDHQPSSPPAYSPYRKTRSGQYFELFKELYGIDQISGSLSV